MDTKQNHHQVSIVKLWLLGFYMCTLSCALGSSSSSPRLLNCIGQDRITPLLELLGVEVLEFTS